MKVTVISVLIALLMSVSACGYKADLSLPNADSQTDQSKESKKESDEKKS